MELEKWLKTLYVPKEYRESYDDLSFLVKSGKARDFTRADTGLLIPILMITIVGKGNRATYHGYAEMMADTGKLGDKMGEISVSPNALARGYPCRFKYESHKFLILKGNK